MKIGLSLSLCIREILNGKVNLRDVTCIITNTRAVTRMDWQELMDSYNATYWKSYGTHGGLLATQMYLDGKIVQPRVNNQPGPRTINGIWLNIEDVGHVG